MVTRLIVFAFSLFSIQASGQALIYSVPERLSSNINTSGEESMPLLSPDGKKLFFTRALYDANTGGKYAGHDVWISQADGGSWGKADNRKIGLNDKNNNAVIGMNNDGSTLYLMNAASSKKTAGIYFSKNESGEWSKPEFIPVAGIESSGFIGFYVSPDFDVLFISMKGIDTQGEEDLYISIKDASGQWPAPRNLGTSINTKGFEISPFLSADKKKLYFASSGHPGQGDADIFVSERLYESWEVWTSPQNLGDKINSPAFDAFYSTYGDTVAYFSSNRSSKSGDLFVSHVSKPVVVVKKEVVREYLSDKEVLALGVSPLNVYFDAGVSDLKENQKQSLGKIAAMLNSRKEILCGLIVQRRTDAQDLEVYEKRLLSILDLFKKAGVEGSRVTFGIEKTDKLGAREKEMVSVKFYR